MTVQRAHRAFRRKRSPRADPEFVPKVDIPPEFVNTRPVSTVRTGPRVPAAPVPSLDGMPPPPLPSPELAGKSLAERLAERISVPTVAAEPEIVVEREPEPVPIAESLAESYPTVEEVEAAHLAKQKAEHDA